MTKSFKDSIKVDMPYIEAVAARAEHYNNLKVTGAIIGEGKVELRLGNKTIVMDYDPDIVVRHSGKQVVVVDIPEFVEGQKATFRFTADRNIHARAKTLKFKLAREVAITRNRLLYWQTGRLF